MAYSFVAVCGPTATGKTALGVELSGLFNGEIISCDSMQIYKNLPIGTAQPGDEELKAAPHHLVAFLDVSEPFSVSDYERLAAEKIEEISLRGKLPIFVGGTGLYIRSLLRGFSFEETARDEALRERLFARAEAGEGKTLYDELKKLDPVSAAQIHPNNLKRVIRALEYCMITNEPFSSQAKRNGQGKEKYNSLLLCLNYRDRQRLYDKINSRVDKMLSSGLLNEAKALYKRLENGEKIPTAAQAIGYKELFAYFRGEASLNEAVDRIKTESRRYAKRQITWFSHEPQAQLLYVDDYADIKELTAAAAQKINEWKGKNRE